MPPVPPLVRRYNLHSNASVPQPPTESSASIYDLPDLYQPAFGFRDVRSEVPPVAQPVA